MKNVFLLAVFCLLFSWTNLAAQNTAPSGGVEVSFMFNRQSGFSTNQFAIWIEDSRGNVVKTLYATKFTATGGWSKRPQSIPLWVQKSGLSALNKKDIDALTGSTPRNGSLSYRWDGLDKNGNRASAGEYRLFLEATLRGDDGVLYNAPFTLGGGTASEAEVKATYFGSGTRERGMIENVKVVYRP